MSTVATLSRRANSIPSPQPMRQVEPVQPEQIAFHCSHCGGGLKVPAAQAGVSGPCPLCSSTITAPVVRDVAMPGQREFRAVKRIVPTDDFKDDGWKERYKNDLKSWKKRKLREKRWHDFLESKACRKLRIVGIATLVAVLLGTFAFVYWDKKLGSVEYEPIFDGAQPIVFPR